MIPIGIIASSVQSEPPDLLDDLQLWLRASDLSTITESAGRVSQWSDKSGNGYHVLQGTGSQQPWIDAVTLGGKSVMDFRGAQRLRRTASMPLGNAPNVTVYMLARYQSSGLVVGDGMSNDLAGANTARLGFRTMSGTEVEFGGSRDGISELKSVGKVSHGSDWALYVGHADYPTLSLYREGTLVQSSNVGFTQPTANSLEFAIGNVTGAFSYPLTGQIAEYRIYHALHNSDQRAQVSAAINHHWGRS